MRTFAFALCLAVLASDRIVRIRTGFLGSGRLQEAAQRPARRHQREPRGAGGRRRGDVPHRLPHRAAEPDRLRPPVRAHDVSGVRKRRQVRARPHRQRERRHVERLDAVRPHQLLRGDAVECARARDVARGGPDAVAEDHAGNAQEPAGRGQRRGPRQRPEPAVRRLRVARPAAEGEHELVQRPQFLRRPVRPPGGDPRGREEVLRHLLRAEQRRARRLRRHDAGRGHEAGREALRRHPVARRCRRARTSRSRRRPPRRRSPRATSWRARRRSRSAITCRTA